MGVTVNANNMSIAHKGSNGVGFAFPDVCKVPAPPAPPIPTPFPNIAQTTNLTKGTKKVKVDGNSVFVKGSQFSRSSGDEAGTLKGIISNQNMGKAEFMNQSMDVKFEGKAVHRLLDPVQQNTMSPTGNALSPAEIQGPVVVIDLSKVGETQEEACKKYDEKKIQPETKEAHEKAAENAGMLPEDYDAIRDVISDPQNDAIISFRDTNKACAPHLRAGVPSKGHDVLTKTFDASNLAPWHQEFAGLVSTLDKKPPKGEIIRFPKNKLLLKKGKPLTGDYDMGDMITASTGERIRGASEKEGRLIERMNSALPGKEKRVMHGAQANYGDYLRSEAAKGNLEKPVTSLNQPAVDPKKCEGLTVFDGSCKPKACVHRLETPEDVVNMYRCKGTEMPPEWNIQDGSGKKVEAKIKK